MPILLIGESDFTWWGAALAVCAAVATMVLWRWSRERLISLRDVDREHRARTREQARMSRTLSELLDAIEATSVRVNKQLDERFTALEELLHRADARLGTRPVKNDAPAASNATHPSVFEAESVADVVELSASRAGPANRVPEPVSSRERKAAPADVPVSKPRPIEKAATAPTPDSLATSTKAATTKTRVYPAAPDRGVAPLPVKSPPDRAPDSPPQKTEANRNANARNSPSARPVSVQAPGPAARPVTTAQPPVVKSRKSDDITMPPRYQAIMVAAGAGQSALQIAAAQHIPLGEVELVISLAKFSRDAR